MNFVVFGNWAAEEASTEAIATKAAKAVSHVPIGMIGSVEALLAKAKARRAQKAPKAVVRAAEKAKEDAKAEFFMIRVMLMTHGQDI